MIAPRPSRAVLCVRVGVLVALLLALPRAALAWVEVHVEGDDARVTLDATGGGKIEHRITLKVGGGPLKSFDLKGVEPDAVPEIETAVVPQKPARGPTPVVSSASAELMPPERVAEGAPTPVGRTLRVRFADRGLMRGVYVVRVVYRADFSSRIVRSGRMAHISARGLAWADDGLDNARVTFDLPSAPNAPFTQPAPEPDAARDGAEGARPLVLSSVRRGGQRDEIELLRPYVPKGEAPTWAFEADALAFAPMSAAPRAAPKSLGARVVDKLGEPAQRTAALAVALALFVAYAALIARKSLEVRRGAEAAGVAPRPVVPLPVFIRAALGGGALVAGVAFEVVYGRATLGASLVAAAAAFAAHATPRLPAQTRLRAPGRWLPVATAQAFVAPPRRTGAWLDVSTRAGKILLLLALVALGGVVFVVADFSPFRADLIAFDATAILAIFGTGRLAELPPDAAIAAAPRLGAVAKRVAKLLAKTTPARLVARIRVPDGESAADEMRLVVKPATALRGLVAVEVGYVFLHGAGGSIALPEVLVRVDEGSAAADAIAAVARAARSSRGRKPGERVFAFRPRLPTLRMTAQLVARLARLVAAPAAASATPAQRAA